MGDSLSHFLCKPLARLSLQSPLGSAKSTHAAKRFSSDARSNRERGLIAAPFSRDDRSLVRPREGVI